MELYIEGNRMDLSPDQVLAVTVQSNDITKPDTVQSSYSNTLTLPFTAANHAALGHAAQPTSQHPAPYRKLEALVLQDGVEVVAQPKAYLLQAAEGYEVQVFSGALDFFARLGDKSIRDLDLSRFNHTRDFAAVVEGSRYYRTYEQGYIYDAIDTGKPGRWAEDMHPSVFARAVFEQLLKEAGVSYTGIDDVLWDRLILPFSNDTPVHNAAWLEAHSFDEVLTIGRAFQPAPFHGLIDFEMEANILRVPEQAATHAAKFLLQVYKEGVLIQALEQDITTIGANSFKGSFTIPAYEDLAALKVVATFQNTYHFSDRLANGFDMGVYDYMRIAYSPKNDAFYKTEWDVALNLPDIKQKDFFKAVRSLFDLMPAFDPYSNTMTLAPFNRLQENFPMALDWSQKMVRVDNRPPAVSYRFGAFAQKSWWRYKEDERGGNGDAYLAVDDEQLEAEKNLVELPFAASADEGGVLRIPLFAPIAEKPEHGKVTDTISTRNSSSFDDGDLVLVRDATADARVREGWATYERIEDREFSVDGWALREQQAYHYDRQTVQPRLAVLSETPAQLTLRQSRAYAVQVLGKVSAFAPISFAALLPTRYATLQAVLDRCKGVAPYFLLSPQEVAGYDASVPVWLDEYQAYFYLNSIQEYRPGSPTLCQLWRL